MMREKLGMTWLLGIILLLGTGAGALHVADTDELLRELDTNELAGHRLTHYVRTVLIPLCSDSVLVKEVKAQNDRHLILADIQALDIEWSESDDGLPIKSALVHNAVAQEIKRIVAAHPAIRIAVAMDDQGANVGQNILTTDYWQGDEATWQNSYNGGQGGLDVSPIAFDDTVNARLQQVSLPLFDTDGTVVGSITFGIEVDKLK